MVLRDALVLLAGYFLGSLPVAFLTARVWGVDIRTVGSGNVGATNTFRALGTVAGVATLVLDIAKGLAAVLLAERYATMPMAVAAAGVCAVVGHIYPVWLGFRGGKGVATATGVFTALSPLPAALAAAAFLLTLGLTRYVSIASLTAAAALVVATASLNTAPGVREASVVSFILIAYAHRANVGRVMDGTEPRAGLSRRPR